MMNDDDGDARYSALLVYTVYILVKWHVTAMNAYIRVCVCCVCVCVCVCVVCLSV